MQHFTILALALPVFTTASLFARQSASDPSPSDQSGPDSALNNETNYLYSVCLPTNDTGYPVFDAPCNAIQAIEAECMYGSAGLPFALSLSSSYGSNEANTPNELDNSTQRDCACQSQLFIELQGCLDCFKAHGAPSEVLAGFPQSSDVTSLSSSYCAASATPTLDLGDVFVQAVATNTSDMVSATASSTSYSDPVGNVTDISAYFTPSVMGSSVYAVAQTTDTPSNSTSMASGSAASSSGGSTTKSASVQTSNGQIVATAGGASTSKAAASGSASTTSSGSGAQRTEMAALAGVMALAGFVAVL